MMKVRYLCLVLAIGSACGEADVGDENAENICPTTGDACTDDSACESGTVCLCGYCAYLTHDGNGSGAPVISIASGPGTVVSGLNATVTFTVDQASTWRLELGGLNAFEGELLANGDTAENTLTSGTFDTTGLTLGEQRYRLYAWNNGPKAVAEGHFELVSNLRVLFWTQDTYGGGATGGMLTSAMANDPRVGSVDAAVSCGENLAGYDVVVYWSGSGYSQYCSDPGGIGNSLASYLDAGGAVVYWTGMQGRAMTSSYLPLVGSSASTAATDLGIGEVLSGHPILDNVTSLAMAARKSFSSTDPSAVTVAEWSDGQPLVAVKGAMVGISWEPRADDGSLSGNWEELLGNAIVYAATQASL